VWDGGVLVVECAEGLEARVRGECAGEVHAVVECPCVWGWVCECDLRGGGDDGDESGFEDGGKDTDFVDYNEAVFAGEEEYHGAERDGEEGQEREGRVCRVCGESKRRG